MILPKTYDRLILMTVLVMLVAGAVAGARCTWGFILLYSIGLGLTAIVSAAVWVNTFNGYVYAFVAFGLAAFLLGSWGSFWVSLTGVFR